MKTAGIIKITLGCLILIALIIIAVGLFTGRGYALWRTQDADVPQASVESVPAGEADSAPAAPRATQKQQAVSASAGAGKQADVGGMSYSAADVRGIDVEWIAGGVEVVVGTGDAVTVSETSSETLTEEQKMRCFLQGGKLKITYCDDVKNVWKWFSMGNYSMPAKQLTIELPASLVGTLGELDIESVSADVSLSAAYAQDNDVETVSGEVRATDLVCRELSINTTSAKIQTENCTMKELDAESISGNSKLSGSFDSVEANSVSGNIDILSSTVPRELEGHTVNGNISVTLPKDAEFSARLETVSGDLTSEFAGVMSKDSFVCGNGANRFEFESVNGDVELLAS